MSVGMKSDSLNSSESPAPHGAVGDFVEIRNDARSLPRYRPRDLPGRNPEPNYPRSGGNESSISPWGKLGDCRKIGVCPSLNSDIRLVDSSCLGVPLASAEQLDEMREEDQESDRDGPKRGEQDGGAGHIERLADPLVMLLANGPSDPFNRRVQ